MAYIQHLEYNGFLLYVLTREELVNHFDRRFEHHVRRNGECLKEADEINDKVEAELAEQDTVTDRFAFKSSNSYTSPMSRRDQLRLSARSHASKAALFDFRRTHLPAETHFYLSEHELSSLELVFSA